MISVEVSGRSLTPVRMLTGLRMFFWIVHCALSTLPATLLFSDLCFVNKSNFILLTLLTSSMIAMSRQKKIYLYDLFWLQWLMVISWRERLRRICRRHKGFYWAFRFVRTLRRYRMMLFTMFRTRLWWGFGSFPSVIMSRPRSLSDVFLLTMFRLILMLSFGSLAFLRSSFFLPRVLQSCHSLDF